MDKDFIMLNGLMQRIQGVKEIEAEVVGRTRKPGESTYTATFREIGGKQRTFTETFAAYYNGLSTPKPQPGSTVTLLVTRRNKVIHAGASH